MAESRTDQEQDNALRVIRLQGIADLLGITRHTLKAWIKRDPDFPKPFQVVPGVWAFYYLEVQGWLYKKRVHARALSADIDHGDDVG